ncbi:LOW QUALITY PROTEIN: integral membrane protein 2B-like [Uloborus diversus]|uniref:LOW QUALITY PROTEIN: integral membrane protein 2B-like n=1 Tax=Uloborus diversus TaxID=327109 RepID=UPI002409043F|nr:LOW QUALITY PROTEIN: integral membrane protein 2B-like [Uloborus diversus]
MTIAQQFLGKKGCKHQEEPLVPSEKSANLKDAEEGRPVVVTMHAHVRRVSSLTTLCVFATALLVLTTGIIGGMYLYRQFAHYKLRHFRGWCSIPYLPDIKKTQYPIAASQRQNHRAAVSATESWEMITKSSPKANFFDEEFEIDVKYGEFERIEVPSFAHGRRSLWVHDFKMNKTALVDHDNRRCFLMVLNRNFVSPPRVLYEQISKMRSGYYDADTQTVRHTMQVITPALSDLKNVGMFIARDCATFPVYKLEKATFPVYKRSLAEDNDLFVEFAGNKVNEYKIINLKDATPGENASENS